MRWKDQGQHVAPPPLFVPPRHHVHTAKIQIRFVEGRREIDAAYLLSEGDSGRRHEPPVLIAV